MDISVMIGEVKLNIRVGIILKYEDVVLIEISKEGRNSVVPGGRVKVKEDTISTILRELQEELGFIPVKERIVFNRVMENFFEYDSVDVHEIYFLYEYCLTEEEYIVLNDLRYNKDNSTTYFKFISKDKINEVNLLPKDLIDIINK